MATIVTDRNGVPVTATEIVLSADGSKVAFVSARADLVPGDTNGGPDVFLQDLATGEITLASSDSAGDGANQASWAPALSPDGTKLAFVSAASNLAPGDSGQTLDLFVKDLATGRVERIGTGLGNTQYRATFSPDGATLLFASSRDDLVPGDINYKADVFLADLATGAITRVSTGALDEQANGTSLQGVWSPDGTKVAFVSQATNLVGGSWTWDVFLKDLATGEILDVTGNLDVDARIAPVFSPDGSHVVVATQQHLHLLDLATRARAELPLGPWQYGVSGEPPVFSPDGTKIALWAQRNSSSEATLLIKDLVTGSLIPAGPTAPWHALSGSLSWVGDTLASVGSFARLQPLAFVSLVPLDADKGEGDSGGTDFTFTVTRSGDLSQAHSVKWAVDDAYQVEARYFGGTVPSGTVHFAAGEATKTIAVKVPGNTALGSHHRFHVSLSDPSSGLLVDVGGADGRILDDDMRTHDDAYFTVAGQSLHVPASIWGTLRPPVYEAPPPPPPPTTGSGGFVSHLISNVVGMNGVSSGGTFYPNSGINDGLHTGYGSLLAGGVLANDAPQIPPLFGEVIGFLMGDGTFGVPQFTASLVQGPAHGALTLGVDGQFDYTPDPGFTGVDQFIYKATGIASSALGSAEATALIYVVPQIEGDVPTLDLLALSAEQQVAATYLAFFGRGADAAGLAFWVDEFHEARATQAPATLLSNIASSFGISAEAAQQYAFLAHPFASSDTEIGAFLVSVYGNLFGRGVDTAGKAYWTDQIKQMLAAGEFVGGVLVDIMSGAQNPAASSGPHDALSLMGRVAVSLAYVHAQQEAGTLWTAADNLDEAKAILQGVSEIPGTVLTGIARAENVVFFDS